MVGIELERGVRGAGRGGGGGGAGRGLAPVPEPVPPRRAAPHCFGFVSRGSAPPPLPAAPFCPLHRPPGAEEWQVPGRSGVEREVPPLQLLVPPQPAASYPLIGSAMEGASEVWKSFRCGESGEASGDAGACWGVPVLGSCR